MKALNIEKRIQKSLDFLKNKTPGTFLYMRSDYGVANYEMFWVNRLHEHPIEHFLDRKIISRLNNEYLKGYRSETNLLMDLDDDAVPSIDVYCSIGSITSMMSGAEVVFASGTGWSSPNFAPDEIDITFKPDNPWVQFHLMVNEDLISKWDGDFALMPCYYRSPLDAANGLLGDKIFLMMHDDCETVLRVVMGCAEWSLKMEEYLCNNLKWPNGLHRAVWGVAMPDKAVFVNGDPVDLISGELQQKLDKPSAERLFTNTGGGFFHHHALGIRQAVNLSYTRGMLVQNIYTDPNVDIPALAMIEDEDIRNHVIDASLRTPIHINTDFLPVIDDFIPTLKKGCFILRQDVVKDASEAFEKLQKIII
jgi:hypothetical protein